MRIVILFAKAGGGHESSAKALKTQMLEQNPSLTVELIDILANSPRWKQELFCQSYIFFTDKIPLVWSGLQILWKIDLIARLTALPLQFQIKNHLQEILNSRPDKIICTYFLVDNWLNELQNSQQNTLEINKIKNKSSQNSQNTQPNETQIDNSSQIQNKIEKKIPIWTIVTDIFSPHSVWFVGKNCNYLVFSNRAKLAAQNRGVSPDKIVEFGVFFGERFEKVGTKLEIKEWKNQFLINQNLENQMQNTLQSNNQNSNLPKNLEEKITKENPQNLEKKVDSEQGLEIQNQEDNSQNNFSQNFLDISKNLTNKMQLPTLLVVGGGESMPGGTPILENLLNLEIQFNLIFVCGRNENLRQKCQKIVSNWQKNNSNQIINIENQIQKPIEIPIEKHSNSSVNSTNFINSQNQKNPGKKSKFHKNIQILGFTSHLYELINISDLVVCKAGPATILEVISQQKTFLISHLIWEQEIGNKDFAVSKGVAIYEKKPWKLAQKVQELFTNPQKLNNLTKNYQNFQIQNDLRSITKFLIDTK